ncbi:hypothetical protein BH24ACT15_BH24ACT15_07440 [soil metagenome]
MRPSHRSQHDDQDDPHLHDQHLARERLSPADGSSYHTRMVTTRPGTTTGISS